MPRKLKIEERQVFGKLQIIKEITPHLTKGGTSKRRFECQCDCGKSINVILESLMSGVTRSCGCLHRESSAENGRKNIKHGARSISVEASRTYSSWRAMKVRCNWKKGDSYSRYGGRGIKVCKQWQNSYERFLLDMGHRPIGKTLDRIDNAKDYSPENCRWATPKEQALNREDNIKSAQEGWITRRIKKQS